MAALWAARCSVKTLVVEKRPMGKRLGQADGLAMRSLEIFDSFGIANIVQQEYCPIGEVSRIRRFLYSGS